MASSLTYRFAKFLMTNMVMKSTNIVYIALRNGCNTGMSGLPDMYTRGPQARGLRVDISGRPRVPVLQLLCNTSFPCKWLHYIYSSTYCFRLWVRIMTFILRF